MKYAIQAAAAVLSAGAYGLVKAQEARKQEEQKQQKLHLRSTSHSHPRLNVNSERHASRILEDKCDGCHGCENRTTKIPNPGDADCTKATEACGFLGRCLLVKFVKQITIAMANIRGLIVAN